MSHLFVGSLGDLHKVWSNIPIVYVLFGRDIEEGDGRGRQELSHVLLVRVSHQLSGELSLQVVKQLLAS